MGQIIAKDFYVYASNVAVNSGANATDTVNIEASSDFVLQKLTYQADIAAAAFTASARPVPNITVQLTDTGSGQQLFSDAIPIPTLFGTGELPFILPLSRLFKANSTIAIQYTNYDAAVNYNIYLSLIGQKLYRK